MKNKLLITGGSGLIGNYLKEIGLNAKYVSSKDYDLLKLDEVKSMFKETKPDTVIHLAALVGGIHHNIEEPVKYFEENILMNTYVIKESYNNGVKNFTDQQYKGRLRNYTAIKELNKIFSTKITFN